MKTNKQTNNNNKRKRGTVSYHAQVSFEVKENLVPLDVP